MKAHRNLLWIQGEPELLDRLLLDATLSKLMLVRPAPDLCGVRPREMGRLSRRLVALGLTPRLVGSLRR